MSDITPEQYEAMIREADKWLGQGEGVDLLYYWPKDEEPELRELMAQVIYDE